MRLGDRGRRAGQATAIWSDEEVHLIVPDESLDERCHLGTAAVVIVEDQLKRKGASEIGNVEASSGIGLLHPQAQTLTRLAPLQGIDTGFGEGGADAE
jgi:hypothetical protein